MSTAKPESIHVEFPEFAPSAIPAVDTPIVGKFIRLLRGPENEFGIPLIVEFEAVQGAARSYADSAIEPLKPGNKYGLWLIHQSIRDDFKEARPVKDERFAVKYLGERVKRDALKAGRDGQDKTDRYHSYAFVMPDRPQIDDEITWDTV